MIEPVVQLDAIRPEWLTEALRSAGALAGDARVTDACWQVCGTGQLADSYRFTLSYEPVGAGPRTLVGKFLAADTNSRAFGATWSGFTTGH